MMRECNERHRYLVEGKIQVDANRRLVLPGGLSIPLNRDKSIKQKVDDYWIAQNIQQEQHHYYEHDVLLYDTSTLWDQDEDDRSPEEIDHALYAQALEMVNSFEQTGRTSGPRKAFDGVELPRRSGPPPGPRRPSTPFRANPSTPGIIPISGTSRNNADNQSRAQASGSATEAPRKSYDAVARPASPKEADKRHADQTRQARERLHPEEASAPIRNRAPAADDEAADRIFKSVLDNTVTLPIRDMLGASADLRRLLQKFTTNRRTPEQVNIIEVDEDDREERIQEVFQYTAYDHLIARTSKGEYAAHEALPLLCIRVQMGGYDIDTIIDTGATICCISDRVWKLLGESALKERSISMRDANGNVANTMGAIVDMPVVIGGLQFYLTFHVCKDAPFECILGTPFCAISSIRIIYRPSAEMIAEITDPNTETTVLIPGRAQVREMKKGKSVATYLDQNRRGFR